MSAPAAPQVELRAVEARDKPRLLDWRNRPDVARWMYTDHTISPDEHDRWFAGALADPHRRYWIIEVDGRPVGLANLYDISPEHHKAGWAYYLADPDLRGKGVGAYVEFWMIEHVFREEGLTKLWCEVLVENESVWKLHESFGFRREAMLREHVWKTDGPQDVVGLALLAEDWRQARPESVRRLQAKGYDLS